MSDREAILGRIRQSLGSTRRWLEGEAARNGYGEAPPPGPFVPATLPLVEQFTAELEALKAHAHVCPTPEAALEAVRELLVVREAESLLHWDFAEIPLAGLEPMLAEMGIRSAGGVMVGTGDRGGRLQMLETVPIGLSGVDAAVAESGTLLVVSGPGRGRLASLLPPVHIAVLPASRIVRALPAAFALVSQQQGPGVVREHSNVTLISGPSRTGDIEQTLTLGIHGPKELHVVIVGGTG